MPGPRRTRGSSRSRTRSPRPRRPTRSRCATRSPTCDRSDVPDELDWLAPDERDRIEAFRFAPRRGDFLLGRWTAKRLLATVLPGAGLAAIAIRAAADGAPEAVLDGARLPFSV